MAKLPGKGAAIGKEARGIFSGKDGGPLCSRGDTAGNFKEFPPSFFLLGHGFKQAFGIPMARLCKNQLCRPLFNNFSGIKDKNPVTVFFH